MHVAPRMAALWRGRFVKLGVNGLLEDAPRSGRKPTIGAYIDRRNENPRPFIWTAKASDILENVTRARIVLYK